MTPADATDAQSPSQARVGIVGLGIMGRPMTLHALRGLPPGSHVAVTARRPQSAAEVIDAGAQWFASARELGAACDVVILMVPDLPDVRAVLDGPDGLLAEITTPTVLVISSTVSPDGVRELSSELATRTGGLVTVVDAPVSGGEEGAIAGTLSIMVGGSSADVQRVMPVLSTMGTPEHLGALGAGQVAKACNQMIVAGTLAALGEAAVVAERAGLDVRQMFALLQRGLAASRLMEVKAERYATHDYTPSAPAKFMIKDLGFAVDEARGTQTHTPVTDVLRTLFTDLTQQGFGDQDTAVVQAYIAAQGPGRPRAS